MSRRIARLPAVVAISAWYAAGMLLANVLPHGIATIAAGFLLLMLLGAYCALRPGRGDLVGSVAVAPILAALALTDLLDVPAWTVAYPGAAVALLGVAWIDHADRRRNCAAPPAP